MTLLPLTGERRYPRLVWAPAFPTDQVRGLKAHGKAHYLMRATFDQDTSVFKRLRVERAKRSG
jgi:hypothetical protein